VGVWLYIVMEGENRVLEGDEVCRFKVRLDRECENMVRRMCSESLQFHAYGAGREDHFGNLIPFFRDYLCTD